MKTYIVHPYNEGHAMNCCQKIEAGSLAVAKLKATDIMEQIANALPDCSITIYMTCGREEYFID